MSVTETIKNRYGSKKGLLRYFAYKVLHSLGCYSAYAKVDLRRTKRLVFVCQGNICRSPLGQAVACQQGIEAISFGLNTRGDDPADIRAVEWGKLNGFDLSGHKTMRVDQYKPKEGDLIIGMEPKHIRDLVARFSQAPVQITLMGLWLKSPEIYLHDPYNANEQYFVRCEQVVADSTMGLLRAMKG